MDPLKRKRIARGVLRSHCKTIERNINGLLDEGTLAPEFVNVEVVKNKFRRKSHEDKGCG